MKRPADHRRSGRDGALREILALSERTDLGRPLDGKGVALVFEKPSARTRNSTEMAVVQLGGHPVYIQKEEVGLGTRESAEDVARTLACYHAIIAARVMDHRHLVADGRRRRDVPVAQPPLRHATIRSRRWPTCSPSSNCSAGSRARRIAYVGDADNNVARSLAEACVEVGAELTLASPEGYALADAPDGVRQVDRPGRGRGGRPDRLYRRLGVDGPGRRSARRGVRRSPPIGSTRR